MLLPTSNAREAAMKQSTNALPILAAACLVATPAQALTLNLPFNPFVPIFQRFSLLTDFFGFLGLILRNWIVFATEVFPPV